MSGKSSNSGKWALGAIVAAAVGYVAGILTAPKSGKETREDLKHNAERVISETEKNMRQIHDELEVVIEDTRELLMTKKGKAKVELDKAYALAKDKQEKVKELLHAVKDGNETTKDPELKKALKEAASALNHLKTYLAK